MSLYSIEASSISGEQNYLSKLKQFDNESDQNI